MSDAIAFDTHKFVKHLTEKGFTEEQAEALAIEQINLLNLLNSNLATTSGIKTLRQTTKDTIEGIKSDLLKFKSDVLKWWIGGLTVQGGLIVTLVKLL